MLTRRIIPCMDIRHGRVVKGRNFSNLVDVGDPIERAARYMDTGADELCFLDVVATTEARHLSYRLIEGIAVVLAIPFTVGGGLRTVEDARRILRAGADKVAVNTAALTEPALLGRLAAEFGSQCIVISIDTRFTEDGWVVTTHGGTRNAGKPCLEWAEEATQLGAGEVLLNVIDADGRRKGFDLAITRQVVNAVTVPVIASGGGGHADHFVEVFRETAAAAALAASIFHDDSYTPDVLKKALRAKGIEVRS